MQFDDLTLSHKEGEMSRRHIIITGTGRAGTTFLVQLLTQLKLNTGFADPNEEVYENCNAGMERDLREEDAPYIVKSPFICDYLDEVLTENRVVIDHAIVPVRDLYSAAQSRRDVVERTPKKHETDIIPGGLWHTQTPTEQENVLAHQMYKLIYALAKHDVPTTLLLFPKMVRDAQYLYGKIGGLFPSVTAEQFLQAHKAISRPELVHQFRPQKSKMSSPCSDAR